MVATYIRDQCPLINLQLVGFEIDDAIARIAIDNINKLALNLYIRIISKDINDLSASDAKDIKVNLVYTSAACGGIFDLKLLYLAVAWRCHVVCNHLTVERYKTLSLTSAKQCKLIAKAERHGDTTRSTDADLSTTENLRLRNIYFVQSPFLSTSIDDICDCAQDDYDSEIKPSRVYSQTWFTQNVAERFKYMSAHGTIVVSQPLEIVLTDTYWNTFLKSVQLNIESMQTVLDVHNHKSGNDRAIKEALYILIEELICLITTSQIRRLADIFPACVMCCKCGFQVKTCNFNVVKHECNRCVSSTFDVKFVKPLIYMLSALQPAESMYSLTRAVLYYLEDVHFVDTEFDNGLFDTYFFTDEANITHFKSF